MSKKITLILLVISALALVSSINAAVGCKKFAVQGSYTRPDLGGDAWGDNTIHNYIFQLNLHADGTATQIWTGSNDYVMNTGTTMPWVGSWKCRDDGKLVLTLIEAGYLPVPAGAHPGQVLADNELIAHFRSTYLFSVDDANTLTRIQARTRTYAPDQDPTNPAGGTLGFISSLTVTYTRVQASDADLLLP